MEIIGAKIQLDGGDSIKTVGTLRQQLKAAVTDLQSIQQQFGDISPEAQKAAQSVAGLRDSIKDANEVAELFNPEKKFQAFVGVASGIASGFAAAQGAMALFGAESAEVEKAILKVQAAMSLAQGLQGVNAAIEDFKRLGGVIMNLSIIQKANNAINVLAAGIMRALGIATTATSVAFNTLKAAIVTTGIGALVVAIGVLVNKMMELTANTDEAAEAQKKLREEAARTANEFADEIAGIYDDEAKLQVARAKAAGKTEEEIAQIQREANENATTERRRNYLQQLGDGLDATEAQKKLKQQETENELFELGIQQKAREDAEKKQKEAADKAAADRKKRAEEDKKIAKDLEDLSAKNVEQAKAQGEREAQQREEKAKAEADALKESADRQIAAQDAQLARDKEQSEARKAIDQAELDHKYAIAFQAANILQGLAQLAGEQTVAGKVLAITGATIATYASAQQAYWSAFLPVPTYLSPVLGALAAGAAVVTGLANIKRIAAVQVPGQGGGGSSVPSITNTAAPITPQGPQTSTTRLDQQSINNIGNAVPARAYVLETDIKSAQERARRLEQSAKFG